MEFKNNFYITYYIFQIYEVDSIMKKEKCLNQLRSYRFLTLLFEKIKLPLSFSLRVIGIQLIWERLEEMCLL